jgi:DNA-binding response OmpR family regulator
VKVRERTPDARRMRPPPKAAAPAAPARHQTMLGKPQILIVDDEPKVRLLLRRYFEREGLGVSEAKNGAELRARMAQQIPDLITLDLTLGSEDGLELAREVRATCNVPIIMITGKGDTVDRVVGLELGADDYITKPFQLREVLARVRAVLRRYGAMEAARPAAQAHERYGFDTMVLDVTQREFSRDGVPQELTTAEFNLLAIFVKRPHRVLTRDNIMDLLKGHEWSPIDRSIDALIGRLRKKLEHDAEQPRLIKTVRGIGYAFTADVARL